MATLSWSFSALYPARTGRPSIPPEMLLRAMLLQAFYSIHSERQLMERLEFDLLFWWFVGLGIDDRTWDHSSSSKNRDRLLAGEIAARFLAAVLAQPRGKRLLSSDHFSVDGTLIEAQASIKSFEPRDHGDTDQGEDPPQRKAARSSSVSVLGKWRIVELSGYEDDYADMVEPAYILFENGYGEFAFGCVTGAFADRAGRGIDSVALAFDWSGTDKMDPVRRSGSAELQAD